MKRRFLAILLTICMVVSMAPAALAADSVFTDANAADWFADEVEYVYENNLMNGVGDNQFDPAGDVTRAMMWTTLARMDGENTTGSDPWWLAGQKWVMENGISDGTMAESNLTREQMVTMLWRYAKYIGEDISEGEDTNILSYTDAFNVNEWAISAMQWACASGIINGIDGALQPQGYASRAQLAAILYRFVEEVVNAAPVTHTVTFLWNYDDKGAYKTVEVENDQIVGRLSTPSRSGYYFSGWYTEDGARFALNAKVTNDVMVYAKWLDYTPVHTHSWSVWSHNGDDTHTRICGNDSAHTETADCAYGSWIANGNGTHTKTCSGCGHEETADCAYGYVPKTDGTHTRTCSVCGEAKTEMCSFVIPEPPAVPACKHCSSSGENIVVATSDDALEEQITSANKDKTILLKQGTYTDSINIDSFSGTILGEKKLDGTNGVTITQSGDAPIFRVQGSDDPNVLEHVVIGGMNLISEDNPIALIEDDTNQNDGAAIVISGKVAVDLYDLTVTTAIGPAVTIEENAEVTLTILGDVSLTGAKDGIQVSEGATLTLTGPEGTLVVKGGSGNDEGTAGSGIGYVGGYVGTIEIKDLKSLTAEGWGNHAFGIGGNALPNHDDDVKDLITIEDTTIEYVKGGHVQPLFIHDKYGSGEPDGGAAIGVGTNKYKVTLNGVTIKKADGGSKSAAIGSCCHIGVAIEIIDCKLQNIHGGNASAGIGGGRIAADSGDRSNEAVSITIEGSTITVTGGQAGAGIGSGYDTHCADDQPLCRIDIVNSTITATGGKYAAGVGTGYHHAKLTGEIIGSTINATSGEKFYKAAYTQAQDIGFGVVDPGREGQQTDSSITVNGVVISIPPVTE